MYVFRMLLKWFFLGSMTLMLHLMGFSLYIPYICIIGFNFRIVLNSYLVLIEDKYYWFLWKIYGRMCGRDIGILGYLDIHKLMMDWKWIIFSIIKFFASKSVFGDGEIEWDNIDWKIHASFIGNITETTNT